MLILLLSLISCGNLEQKNSNNIIKIENNKKEVNKNISVNEEFIEDNINIKTSLEEIKELENKVKNNQINLELFDKELEKIVTKYNKLSYSIYDILSKHKNLKEIEEINNFRYLSSSNNDELNKFKNKYGKYLPKNKIKIEENIKKLDSFIEKTNLTKEDINFIKSNLILYKIYFIILDKPVNNLVKLNNKTVSNSFILNDDSLYFYDEDGEPLFFIEEDLINFINGRKILFGVDEDFLNIETNKNISKDLNEEQEIKWKQNNFDLYI